MDHNLISGIIVWVSALLGIILGLAGIALLISAVSKKHSIRFYCAIPILMLACVAIGISVVTAIKGFPTGP
ncbi:MAG: hypothetical protein GC164_05700 [Phycisphaera sp.]|nr:hypothetical protein [Phycisphaera sp.]